jgi:signal transduction histidine kinase
VEGLKASATAKGLEMTLREGTNIPSVLGDASRLQQVADNLISNAIKFTDQEGRIEVGVKEKGDLVQVYVKDTRPGLSPEEQARVFDMFYQADASARRPAAGAGLGLAIAKGIVTMHGGQILVHSEKGKGATFTFIVPRNKEKKAA